MYFVHNRKAGVFHTHVVYCIFGVLHMSAARHPQETQDLNLTQALSLTCVAPATGKSIGKSHHIGAEHDACPELASDKACQSPTNEEPGHDVASSCVYSCNPKDEGGGKHQKERICCSTQKHLSMAAQRNFMRKPGQKTCKRMGETKYVSETKQARHGHARMPPLSRTFAYSIGARTCRMPGP